MASPGKSDNQNHAIILYHDEYLQLFNANQDVSVQCAFRTTRSCCLPAQGMCTHTQYSRLTALSSFPLRCTSQHRPEEPTWSSYLVCNMHISSDPLAPRCTQRCACALQLDSSTTPATVATSTSSLSPSVLAEEQLLMSRACNIKNHKTLTQDRVPLEAGGTMLPL